MKQAQCALLEKERGINSQSFFSIFTSRIMLTPRVYVDILLKKFNRIDLSSDA
jgi:hypothetical protein